MAKGKAVILLSGGIDSSTTLALAMSEGHQITALSFDYGQRHKYELTSAKRIVSILNIKDHVIMEIDLRQFGGSALTSETEVPKKRTAEEMGTGIPVTYVPARNTIFLSYALAVAEVRQARHIYIGVNAIDYSGYPDCRPEFIKAFEQMANLATKAGVEGNKISIEAPLINLTKAEIIRRGTQLGLDYSLTFSCYDPPENGLACGECDSCLIRKKGFSEAGLNDPTSYSLKLRV